jgi:hypothetical protein
MNFRSHNPNQERKNLLEAVNDDMFQYLHDRQESLFFTNLNLPIDNVIYRVVRQLQDDFLFDL